MLWYHFQVVSILAAKGFQPHRNLKLMQRILAWNSLETFAKQHPDLILGDVVDKTRDEDDDPFLRNMQRQYLDGEYLNLDSRFVRWITEMARKGIDGEILLQLLRDRCIDLMQEYPHFGQKLRNNELGTLLRKTGEEVPELLDFFVACKRGYTADVEIYCKCDMPLSEEQQDRHSSERWRPLALAAINGHREVSDCVL